MKMKWLERSLIEAPHFALATRQKILDAELKRLKHSSFPGTKGDDSACTHFLENKRGKTVAIVCLFNLTYELEQIFALLVHEAVHIYQDLRDQMGERRPGKEFEAYAIQNISQELFYEFKRQTKGKFKWQKQSSVAAQDSKRSRTKSQKKKAIRKKKLKR